MKLSVMSETLTKKITQLAGYKIVRIADCRSLDHGKDIQRLQKLKNSGYVKAAFRLWTKSA